VRGSLFSHQLMRDDSLENIMPRVRVTDTRVPSKVTIETWDPGMTNHTVSVVATPSRYQSGRLKKITDGTVNKYFSQIKKGKVFFNAVEILSSEIQGSYGSWHVGPDNDWGYRTITGSTAAEAHIDIQNRIPAYFSNDVTNAKGRALIEAYAKMKSPDVLLSVFFQEREKTLSMVQRPFRKALSILDKAISRKARLLSLGYSAVQAFESAWLETRYGWRPTMYDLWGIAKAAAHEKPIAGTRLIARGGNRLSWKKTETSQGSFGGLCDRTWEKQSRISAGVMYAPDEMTDLDWKRRCLGLTLDNVPSHVWEVVPFSFVVDWFLNVGQWLRASVPDPRISILGNWVSVVDEIKQTTKMLAIRDTLGTPSHTAYVLYDGDYYQIIDKNLTREVGLPLSGTPLTVETPLSFSNLLDGLFLLHGNILDKFRRFRL